MTYRRRVVAAMAAALVLISAATARPAAHPLATTTVSVVVRAARIDVTVVADAEPLALKLEALAGAATSSARSAADRIASAKASLLDRAHIVVDGQACPLAWRDVVVDTVSTATIHLTAPKPESAREITWRGDFVYGSYPVAFRIEGAAAESVQWLQGSQVSTPVSLASPTSALRTIQRALWMGVTHIVPNGIDHILFVLGLFFLSMRTRQVLLQVTAFTLAHSITLGLTLYGVISLRSSIVEPLIALSVAYVGVENLMTSALSWRRIALVFAFGLLHGMGFAEALSQLHLSRSQFLTTLVSFNAGVEAGQLTVIAAAASLLFVVTRARTEWRRPIARFASASIGLAGFIWVIQRVAA